MNDRLVESLDRSQAQMMFTPDGTIVHANDNFLAAMGYQLDEVVGKHHSMFVDPVIVGSQGYQDFWDGLADGIFRSVAFVRYGKGGAEVWIQATYNPIFDDNGEVINVIQVASDITKQKLAELEVRDRTQAVVEFLPDGTVFRANERFLDVVGYTLDEVKGQHHRMFMPADEIGTPEYAEHWSSLTRGEVRQGQFRRMTKSGRHLYLQGAYNPLFDAAGKVTSVTMAVVDITTEVDATARADDIGREIAGNLSDMDAALSEISARVAGTAGLAQNAESNAHSATDVVKQLDESSESIGKVVTVIQRLSEQTNLLALNATIEAARAGESGRGFAVVANEVKVLSTQTGGATEDIRLNIETIQGKIATVVEAIQGIVDGVAEVSSNTSSVAAAIEMQAALMTQMNATARELLNVNH